MKPTSETELAEMIRAADGPLCIQGAGTRDLSCDGDVLDATGLSGVTLYDPGALTLVAGAGTTLTEVENLLAKEGQRLAFEPRRLNALLGSAGETTLGGIVATNSAGPARIGLGNCADHLLGVRFVNGRGEIVKNGGRVMKNVTGYDLVKLMAGSHGTLGVLTEVSLKVLPKPETEATLAINAGGLKGLSAMTTALASPYEVTGASLLDGKVYLRIEGFTDSVDYRCRKLKTIVGAIADVALLEAEASCGLWKDVCNIKPLQHCEYVWKMNMKPTAIFSGFLAAASQVFKFETMLDYSGGQCWIGMTSDQAMFAAAEVSGVTPQDGAVGFHQSMQEAVSDETVNEGGGGDVQFIKAPESIWPLVSRFQPQSSALARIQSGLRAQFDPRGILNAGLMG
ncbi:FAD-binding protein [Halocynthiibacter styelae]|uniref:FAD-binding protein n=1 Tax=Halocynthiibacter styelae TaxID=2761955 RepID=A0A8J7LLH0_9RHOB|nr:FAD-binding protein [Paenihalocynthiibacter styelae]MBI1494589.1 FAD-binding protein [Paenihalocynthiibacter styelae]